MIKCLDHQSFHICFEEDLRVRVVSGSSENSVFEVRPRRASGLAVCSSCGNERGTRESKELVGVATPSDLVDRF